MHISVGLFLTVFLNVFLSSTSADTNTPSLSEVPRLHSMVARVNNQEGSMDLFQRYGYYYMPVFVNGQRLELLLCTRLSET